MANGIDFGILQPVQLRPQPQVVQIPNIAAQNLEANTGLLNSIQEGQNQRAQLAIQQKELAMKQALQPGLLQQQQLQNQGLGIQNQQGQIQLSNLQRETAYKIQDEKAAKAAGLEGYIQSTMTHDPDKALATMQAQSNWQRAITAAKGEEQNLAVKNLTDAGNLMHEIMSSGDSSKQIENYNDQYQYIKKLDPNAPNPKGLTPKKLEAYGAATIGTALPYATVGKVAIQANYTNQLQENKISSEANASRATNVINMAQNNSVNAGKELNALNNYSQALDKAEQDMKNGVSKAAGPGSDVARSARQTYAAMTGRDPAGLSDQEVLSQLNNKLMTDSLNGVKIRMSPAVMEAYKAQSIKSTNTIEAQRVMLNQRIYAKTLENVYGDFVTDYAKEHNNDLSGLNTSWQQFQNSDPSLINTGKPDPKYITRDNYMNFMNPISQADIQAEIERRGLNK